MRREMDGIQILDEARRAKEKWPLLAKIAEAAVIMRRAQVIAGRAGRYDQKTRIALREAEGAFDRLMALTQDEAEQLSLFD